MSKFVPLYRERFINKYHLKKGMNKKEIFKLLIKEFHERKLPEFKERELKIPDVKKVISITGPRRSGKTYYFYQKISELMKKTDKDSIVYLNFADDRIYPLKLEDLQGLLDAYFELYPNNKSKKIFLFLDEVQEVKKWELFVRRVYDTENISIFVTGSSSKLLHKEVNTALRGRTLNYTMFPLSFQEFLKFRNVQLEKNFEYSNQRYVIKNLFNDYLNNGGFPEIVLNKQKKEILENYLELIIYKDIIERYNIRNLNLIKNLINYLFTNIATLFSSNSYYNLIKKEIVIKKDTINEYLSYIEDANIIFSIKVFSYSLKKQQVNLRKIYCIDNGLRNAVSFKFSKDEGKLAENLVFVELKRRGEEPYYWKDKGEVDFVIKNKNQNLTAINVSYTDEIDKRETEALLNFKKDFKKTKEMIVLTKDLEKQERGVSFVPLWKWLIK